MKTGRDLTTVLALLSLLLILSPVRMAAVQEKAEADTVSVQAEPAAVTDEAPAGIVHGGPQSLKERWGIGVFLIWMWLSIGFLIYFIRLQIREADRVTDLGYDDPIKAGRDRRTP
jgi:hypothetical protein